MRVLVINPNSTARMTEGIVNVARAAAAPDLQVEAVTNIGAPSAIQGPEDGDAAIPGVLALTHQAERDGFDGVIIACFDDTGLSEARLNAGIPVVGIGQAAFLTAMLYGGHYSVITTLPASVPVIEQNIRAYGLAHGCAKVRASGLPVLDLEQKPERAGEVLIDCALIAASEDGAHALVLGCAGMAKFGPAMHAASGLPVIDGVVAAVGLLRTALSLDHARSL